MLAALGVPADSGGQANQPPVLGGVADLEVRPARAVAIDLTASDPDLDPDDAGQSEPVRLQVLAVRRNGGTLPGWLDGGSWEVPATPDPGLRVDLTAASDATAATYDVSVLATDSRGLSASGSFELRMLPPRCGGALEYAPDADADCADCPEHHVPNVSSTACEACPEDTERPSGSSSCQACPSGQSSGGGAPCEAPNLPPTADAGLDQGVFESRNAWLDGSGSSDPEGQALTYAWTQTSGTTVALSDVAAVRPGFKAPQVTEDEVLTFSLTVSDGTHTSEPDTVAVKVLEAPNLSPRADAGSDRTVFEGASVTLDGSRSSDPEGYALTYAWTQTSGTAVALSNATSTSPTFTAPSVSTDGTLTFSLTVSDVEGASSTDTVDVTVRNNTAPTAAAGPDRTVFEGAAVALDGSGSSDPEGQALTYAWTQTSGTTVTLSDATAASPTFTAPSVSADGTLTFSLAVSDGTHASAADAADVTVRNNTEPTADAGPNQTVFEGAAVALDGSGSSDPEGQALTYAWTQTSGATVALSDATAASPTFTAPSVTGTDRLRFKLTVGDGTHQSSDRVRVTVRDNTAPTADAGADQTVFEGDAVALDGSGSSDPEGQALTYAWTQTLGAAVTLSDATAASPTFTAPSVSADGTLTFSLTVSDGTYTSTDTADVTVRNNTAPTANAGPNQTVFEGAAVTLDGSGSSDPEGQALTYAWTQTSGTTVALSDATTASPTFTAPSVTGRNKRLRFELTVDDGTHQSSDRVRVTVRDNTAPTADAGADQTVFEGASATLDGSGSSDPEGQALTYAWTQTSGATVALSDATAASPTFTAPSVSADGTLTFSLTVSDGTHASAADAVNVTVRNNTAPRAYAGPNRTAFEGDAVTLDGSGSSDPEGQALTYAWTQTSGAAVTLSDATAASPTFTAPSVSGTDRLRFKLTVDDGTHQSSDRVRVTVRDNTAPTADAGADQTVFEGDAVALDGSGSSDPEGQALTYAWTQTSGTTVALSDATAASPTFTAPSVSADGTLTFSLTVSDGTYTSTDAADVTVRNNTEPTANAGPNQTVFEGDAVALDGSGSSDPEGQALTYAWTQTSGATVTLSDATAASPTFTAPSVAGTDRLRFKLTVDDGTHQSSDRVRVTVRDNTAPTADAGADQTVFEGASATLDGSGSSDPEGQALTYAWTQTSGTTVALSDATAASPTFTAPSVSADGTLTFSLTVSDGTYTSTDTADVTVRNNTEPTANAGPNQTVFEGDAVALDGSGSSDPEGQALTYAWTQTSGAAVTLSDATAASPTFTAPSVTGTDRLRFKLTVDDGTHQSSDRVRVTVRDNTAPTADAGADQTVFEGASVALDGSGSSDPEGQALTYAWTQTSGTTVALSDATAASPTFTAPSVSADGTLTFSLTVSDGTHTSAADAVGVSVLNTFTLTVAAPANGKVTGKKAGIDVIDCGTDCSETVVEGSTINLRAAAASDYAFDNWGGDCATEASEDCALTMDANKTVSVAFVVACEAANSGDACDSAANNCGATNSGTVQCDGSCSASAPADCDLDTSYCNGTVCTACVDEEGDDCESAPNECGATNSGTIQCGGSCSAITPADCDSDECCSGTACVTTPSNLGQSCTSLPNECGATNSGTIQCDGSCSAVKPADCGAGECCSGTACLAKPSDFGDSCTSAPNECGATNAGEIQCNGLCSAVKPADCDDDECCSGTACLAKPSDFGDACTSAPNECGATNAGEIQCNGLCSAVKPADCDDDECCSGTACLAKPSDFGDACTSAPNECGATNAGEIQCNGLCSAVKPADCDGDECCSGTACLAKPSDFGDACTSAPNECGATNAGEIQCNGLCSAVKPADCDDDECCSGTACLAKPSDFGDSCTSAPNECGATNAGEIQCNGLCSAVKPADCDDDECCSGTACVAKPSDFGDSCTSAPNECGATNAGEIQCNGLCSAVKPADCDDDECCSGTACVAKPSDFGDSCTSAPNECGATNAGEIQCNGLCSAVKPADCDDDECCSGTACVAKPSDFGDSCTSAPNECGATNAGEIQCNGLCSAVKPADCDDDECCSGTVCVAKPSDFGDSCESDPNECGATNWGTIQCDGECSAVKPADCAAGQCCSGTACVTKPSNLGQSCTSDPNECGATNSGTIQCDGSCSAVKPADCGSDECCSGTSCQTTPATGEEGGVCCATTKGNACSSPANNCGETTSGTVQCDGSCSETEAPEECCAESSQTWTVGGDTCTATVPSMSHGGTATVTDSTYSDTGSATYSCNNGTLTRTSSSCYAGCAATVIGACSLGDTVHEGTYFDFSYCTWEGVYGWCNSTCNDGVWSQIEGECASS